MLGLLTVTGVLVLLLLVIDFKWGLCFYIAYMFLVPTQTIYIEGFVLTSIILHSIVLVAFFANTFIRKRTSQIVYKPLLPFIVLFALLLLLIPFQSYTTPLPYMLNTWRQNVMDSIF